MSTLPTKMRCAHILLSWHGAKNSTHTRELAFAIHDAKIILADLIKAVLLGILLSESIVLV